MQQVTVTQVTSGHVLGIGSGQGLVPVGSRSEDTILGREKILTLCRCDLCCAFGLRVGEQAWPTLFDSIGIAIDVFN